MVTWHQPQQRQTLSVPLLPSWPTIKYLSGLALHRGRYWNKEVASIIWSNSERGRGKHCLHKKGGKAYLVFYLFNSWLALRPLHQFPQFPILFLKWQVNKPIPTAFSQCVGTLGLMILPRVLRWWSNHKAPPGFSTPSPSKPNIP